MSHKLKGGQGRVPPPPEHWFLKGKSGNPAGRPKGSVSTKKITRKVALKKHLVVTDGRKLRKTLLELVIEALITRAANGAPPMVTLHSELRKKIRPHEERQPGGLMLAPQQLTSEEFMASEEARNATARDPSTYINHKSEEYCKAVRGIPTALGEAILASHRRWG